MVDYSQAEEVYKQFCPGWTRVNPTAQCGGGANQVQLRCLQGESTLSRGSSFPWPPTVDGQYVTFPQSGKGYVGTQTVYDGPPSLTEPSCDVSFSVGMDCPVDASTGGPCLIFAAWDPDQCATVFPGNPTPPVRLCGENGPY